MSMSIEFKVVNADNIDVTLVATMKLGEWKEIRAQLEGGKYPSWSLKDAITDAVRQAEARFYPVPPPQPKQA